MAGRHPRGLALALCLAQVLKSDALAATAATFLLETSVPEGFDALLVSEHLVVDLYYGGKEIGAAQASVESNHIRFDSPESVLALLPVVKDPERVLTLLGTSQSKNTQYICHSARQVNCGYLLPEEFAVIYDEERFRLDLFFAPELLPQQAAIKDPYLPAASSDFSAVQNLSGTWSGVESDWGPSSYQATLNGNTIISFGESALHSRWSNATEQGSRLHTLHWSRDFRGQAYSVGLLQPQGGHNFFKTQEALYGLELRSSQRSRTDIKYQQGAPLEINMPVRGRIEVYWDKRLVHTELLEAGNRLLNTSTMPHGAYEVEIRTYDETGRALSQHTEFFAKDSLLPAPGEWFWSFQAGLPTLPYNTGTLPEHYDEGLIQGSIARRLSTGTGLFASVAAAEKQQLAEVGLRWVGQYLEFSPSLVTTNEGRSGHRLQALLKTPFATISAMETKLSTKNQLPEDNSYRLLSGGYSQRSFSLQSGIMGGQLSLRYSERDQAQSLLPGGFTVDDTSDGARKLTTLEFRRNFFQNPSWIGNASLSHSDADGQQYTSIGIQFRLRSKHWQHTANLHSENSDSGTGGERLAFHTRWRDQGLWAPEFEQQLSVEQAPGVNYLESRTHLAGHMGYVNATVGFTHDDKGDAINYLGGFSTNLISTGQELAWGGERALESAVIVDIEGSDQQDFEVLVNGVRRGYAKGGNKSVINLPAFKSYVLSLRPLEQGFFDFRETNETVTLYPGNVSSASYQVLPQTLVLGRLMDEDEGIANIQVFIGDHNAITDQYGVFQLEVSGDQKTLASQEITWSNCRIPIKIQSVGESWLNLGTIEQSRALCQIEYTSEAKGVHH
ncbi:TcfC E-set like domain-containing protein [Microbulbifer epialgicus]|uniref:TcfC E-set like domain-containing protein n=1 Tax=Microbulbifer epialgicus TaxID=393907 RepID=A0ABV4P2V8_9GAMM